MKKIFDIHAAKPGRPYNAPTVDISLPAAPYELLDVQERLRAANASEVTVQITYSHTSKYLNLLPIAHGGLYEINALAEKMSTFEDWQQEAFDGLVKADAFKSDKPVPISRLIDFAYSSECCHVLGGITTHKELGEFLVDNELWSDTEEMSEEVLAKLDYTAIGRVARLSQGGVFTDNSYVEQHSELVEAHKTLDYTSKIPDYTMLLKVSVADCDGEMSTPLKLPATGETLNKVLDQIGAGSWQETRFECIDCKAPMLSKLIDNDAGIVEVNRLAGTLSKMPQTQLSEYKAILAAVDPSDFDSAVQLVERMGEYLVSLQYETLEDIARDELNFIADPTSVEVIIPYLDLEGYGAALVKGLNAELPGIPQEQEWMRERLDTLSVKEGIILAAALDGDPPGMASDAIYQLIALPDYKICGYAGNYKQLGEYAANEAMLPKDVRPHLNLEKLGHTYAEAHPGKFCEGHYVEFPEQPSVQRYDPQTEQLPEDTDWSVKLKVSTSASPEEVWIRLPDHQGDIDSNPDEISLALDALNAKSIQELTVLDTRCVLPGTWNLMEQYSDIADLMYDANDLGLALESQCRRSDCFKEFLWAALEYENCQYLRLALEIARNPEFYDWISSDSLEEIAKKELRDQGVSEEIIGSDAIDLKAYGEEILIRNGYVPTSDQTGYILSPSRDSISQDDSPQVPEMQM